MRSLILSALLLAHVPVHAAPMDVDDDMINEILRKIKGGDCSQAVNVVKDGVSKKLHKITLVAGIMHEDGLCVRKDWKKAVDLYMLAAQQGSKRALSQLVAGYAAPGDTHDPAAAVWYAQESALSPAECRVPDAVHADLDKFGAALSSWPKSRLDACVYASGVTAHLAASMEYPLHASRLTLQGKTRITFIPATKTFIVDTSEVEAVKVGVVDAGMMRDQDSTQATTKFRNSVQEAGAKALQRYVQPNGISPAMKTELQFIFHIVIR
jgi:hypothetical protein